MEQASESSPLSLSLARILPASWRTRRRRQADGGMGTPVWSTIRVTAGARWYATLPPFPNVFHAPCRTWRDFIVDRDTGFIPIALGFSRRRDARASLFCGYPLPRPLSLFFSFTFTYAFASIPIRVPGKCTHKLCLSREEISVIDFFILPRVSIRRYFGIKFDVPRVAVARLESIRYSYFLNPFIAS